MMPLSDDVADKVVPSIFHIWNDISGRKEGLVSRVSYPIHHLIIKCVCDDLPTDIVEFDNSYSYLRSKKLWYSIVIEKSN